MKTPEIGGEFALIKRLCSHSLTSHPNLEMGIGDDAAVIKNGYANGDYQLVTTDMLIEENHFRREWSSAQQIGVKSVACNVSDIAAMGGIPTFMFICLALPQNIDVEWAEALYQGIHGACRQYGVTLAGGDTTRGEKIVISITLMGRVSPEHLCLRSQAKPGEILCVTGPLGGSAAGLALLSAGMEPPEYLRLKHLAPTCRLDVAPLIAPYAGAMIDISDGLSSEINHICDRSGTGAEIRIDRLPMHTETINAAQKIGNAPYRFALNGGEDYELLVSIAPSSLHKLQKQGVSLIEVGTVTNADAGRLLKFPDGKTLPIDGGYDHFV